MKSKTARPTPYLAHLFSLRRLQRGGFVFEPDAMPLWMWSDLGLVGEMLDNHAARQRVSLF